MVIVATSARRIVVAYAVCSLVGWLLGVAGATRLPSLPYVAADVVLDVLTVVGLWLLWRPAWVVALGLTLLGEAVSALHPRGHAVLIVIGAVQLVLLLFSPLRHDLQHLPMTASY
jgi:hypothetical protein